MSDEILDCFVIMPISDPEGYSTGHFSEVYKHIVIPSCDAAGFRAYRADENPSSNMIQLDILKQLLDAPMAVCDLSSRNPNVLFELALRQAFDKPVALIQEEGTPRIFDISSLRVQNYIPNFHVAKVPNAIHCISKTIEATYNEYKSGKSSNSIIKLLAVENAKLPEITSSEVQDVKYESLVNKIDQLISFLRAEDNTKNKLSSLSSPTDRKLVYENLRSIYFDISRISEELRTKYEDTSNNESTSIATHIQSQYIDIKYVRDRTKESLFFLFNQNIISAGIYFYAEDVINNLADTLIKARLDPSSMSDFSILSSYYKEAVDLRNQLKKML